VVEHLPIKHESLKSSRISGRKERREGGIREGRKERRKGGRLTLIMPKFCHIDAVPQNWIFSISYCSIFLSLPLLALSSLLFSLHTSYMLEFLGVIVLILFFTSTYSFSRCPHPLSCFKIPSILLTFSKSICLVLRSKLYFHLPVSHVAGRA
jgi:hypothetical protein